MALETYQAKRNFKLTPEPRGGKGRSSGNSFVIQKHDATRLHYDFRLEMDGVLKSWAVTKGPSLNPEDRRLAVHVEDHPLSYADFEGIIPKGQYGGGTVIVWDRGNWTPVGDAQQAYREGHLEFELDGEKLKGRWHLVRMHGRPGEKRENWLLIKGDDAEARHDGDILKERPESAKTGRQLEDVSENPDPTWKSKSKDGKPTAARKPKSTTKSPAPQERDWPKGARKGAMPDFIEPALARLKPKPPAGDRWIHEIKFDGYRLQVRIENGEVRMLTRSGLDWTEKFGSDVLEAFAALPVQSAVIDGEIVVERDSGASDFSALQHDLSEGRDDRFVFYAFDLLHLDGYNLVNAALLDRKQLLESLLPGDNDKLRYSGHFNESGGLVLDHACRLSLEGVISKLRDSKYTSGRKGDWIKSKCSHRQEFVIGGYVPSTSMKNAIGSLAMGYYQGGELKHVGRVGTGYTAATAQMLYEKLSRLTQNENSFDDKLTSEERRGLIYVKPQLVGEVEFRAWSADGNLRHAAFRGLREDKPAKDVTRETEKTMAPPLPKSAVTLTHPDRIYWPDDGVTKEGLANYYAQVWRFMAPYVVNRPLALLRLPDGISGRQRFFQKHAWKGMNPHIEEITDPKDKQGEKLLRITDFDGIVALVQSAALEIHPWGTTTNNWERPDMITMDLDPDDEVEWKDVIAAAYQLKERLEAEGLAAFVKTSGGKGLHVVTPLTPKAGWVEVKAFAKWLADSMSADNPDRYLATATKAKRKGRIFIDYLRNGRGNTAVAPYSTRARPGAAVSMPLEWSELTPDVGPAYFTVDNTPTRLDALPRDPWDGFFAAAKPLEKKKR
ncbi:DNA ligase D [Rhizobium bangladeshense]|uniref:DNA ligase (ATP) n=1 Tax=Rhizobium bangladeshense TaxID=1138189 RepID=A0ABS7LDV4_9HYPH|nr:DNA ligase D [Rhizobium bangladeshense]MBX4865750.1 DNA ligase D [Rhizobium bangladeshense]MBX4872362.1 DNA ligase D [Rhizobium bangladeshense]MBX4882331.1 DNA ligase D [Rhizobium bangladeshense]MBY3589642.1 DNA ligase D [Rhizobium bangladeshense]